jgi:hypothetical protein
LSGEAVTSDKTSGMGIERRGVLAGLAGLAPLPAAKDNDGGSNASAFPIRNKVPFHALDVSSALRSTSGRILSSHSGYLIKLFDLPGDPFERADHESIDYSHWRIERVFLLVPAQAYVAQFLQSFKEFSPRQKPGSFNLDAVLQTLQQGGAGLPSN